MKIKLLLLLLLTVSLSCAQTEKTSGIPDDGKYTYDIAFAEWGGKSMGEKVTVIIKDETIEVKYEGGGSLTAKKGEILDEGMILKHTSGVWIITTDKTDVDAEEVGGCTDGPNTIDFIEAKFWMC